MHRAALAAITLAGAAALGLAACGGGNRAEEGGSATVLMGTAPDFLDPEEGYTTHSSEATR